MNIILGITGGIAAYKTPELVRRLRDRGADVQIVMSWQEVRVCELDELEDPDSRAFQIGDGDWPFKGFVVREGNTVVAYQNICPHAGHPLNWQPHRFLTRDGTQIICASHGAVFEIASGECVAGPCPGRSLRPVDVDVRDGTVYVSGPDTLLR